MHTERSQGRLGLGVGMQGAVGLGRAAPRCLRQRGIPAMGTGGETGGARAKGGGETGSGETGGARAGGGETGRARGRSGETGAATAALCGDTGGVVWVEDVAVGGGVGAGR